MTLEDKIVKIAKWIAYETESKQKYEEIFWLVEQVIKNNDDIQECGFQNILDTE